MGSRETSFVLTLSRSWSKIASRLMRDERGSAAVEFAIVATPFFMLTFGIFGLSIYQFTSFSIQNAVDQAGRAIRTGVYATAGKSGGVMTNAEFKQAVCDKSPGFIDCKNKLKVFVTTPGATFSAATDKRSSCAGNEAVAGSAVPGGSSVIVLVVACYTFDLAKSIPYVTFGQSKGNAATIQASTVFRTEP